MTVAVPVAFPAYVTHVPRRARAAREVLVRGIAPVDLPEADPAGFERPWRLRGACDRGLDLEPWIRGDGLWQPLRQLAVQPGFDGLRGVTPEEFASWLAGDAAEDGPLWKGLSFAFEATPLQRRRPRADLGGLTDANLRGDPGFDDAAAGRVEADGRPEAAAAVARFLREEVVLAGDHVLMRLRPLVAFTLSQGESPWRILPYRGVSWRSLPFALGREGECQSFAERRGRIPRARRWPGSGRRCPPARRTTTTSSSPPTTFPPSSRRRSSPSRPESSPFPRPRRRTAPRRSPGSPPSRAGAIAALSGGTRSRRLTRRSRRPGRTSRK
jgi:hypothetical protein